MGLGGPPVGVLLGHGAGSNMNHPSLVGLVERLAARGLAAGRFNFVYSENGRKARFYELTRAGKSQIEKETENWERVAATMARFLTRPAEQ